MSDDNKKYIDVAKKLILISVFSCFIHFWVARAVIALSVLVFFFLPGVNRVAFAHKGSLVILLFAVVGFIVSLCYKNIYGIGSYPMFFAIMYFSLVVRAVATKDFFEKILDVICLGGCTAALIAVVLEIKDYTNNMVRAKAGFPNPNFLGAALMIVVFVCIYKVINNAHKLYLYFIAAAISGFGIILCGSMSIWVILAIGSAVLFLLNKNNNFLIALICAVAVVIAVLIFKPEIFNRLNEISLTIQNRVNIWSFAVENIKTAPIFGRGFFSYRYLLEMFLPTRPDIQPASLAHNILIDSVLCHGIVGTGLLFTYITFYFKDMAGCRKTLKANKQSRTLNNFIIAVCVAVAVYGFIDTTFIWVQGGTLLMVITSGLGADENKVRNTLKSGLN